MLIANSLFSQFQIPERYAALAVSALLAAVIIVKAVEIARAEKIIYFILNTLLIFSVSVGSHTVTKAATQAPKDVMGFAPFTNGVPQMEKSRSSTSFFDHNWFSPE